MTSFGHLLGDEIRKARIALGWTQKHVALRSFGDEDQVRQVRRYETLKTQNPRPKSYIPICEALGVTHEKIFDLAKASENRENVDIAHLEEMGYILPYKLAQRIRENDGAEDAACDLHHLLVINRSAAAKENLEILMADASLRLMSLDYCFRYYHFAFRSKLQISTHRTAISFLEAQLQNNDFDISDKSAFSIGEFFLYNPHAEIKETARHILLRTDGYSDRVQDLLAYTKRRVEL